MEEKNGKPIVSTYVHVSADAHISHAVDASAFGVSVSLRIGNYGENDASLFFRSPEQLEKIASEAVSAANQMRQAMALYAKIESAK